ncbi:Zn-finger nucleic acid-binding protein [Arthrobacter sp. UYCu712]
MDSIDLIMSERSGVEIDYCPQCRGVWLDRGELDKIIDRAADSLGPAAPAPPVAPPPLPTSPGHIPPPLYDLDPRRDTRRPDDRRYDSRDRPRYDQPGTTTAAAPKRRKAGSANCSTSDRQPPGTSAAGASAGRTQSPSRAMNSRACFMEMSEWRVSAVAAASVSPLLASVRILP